MREGLLKYKCYY